MSALSAFFLATSFLDLFFLRRDFFFLVTPPPLELSTLVPLLSPVPVDIVEPEGSDEAGGVTGTFSYNALEFLVSELLDDDAGFLHVSLKYSSFLPA